MKSTLPYKAKMTQSEQQRAAKGFSEFWAGRGYEKGETARFWIELLQKVFGIKDPTHFIQFEEQVTNDTSDGINFIDARIPKTSVLIEQKSIGKDLRSPIRQSDGSLLTPFQQAKRYVSNLPKSEHPSWIVVCNFEEFMIYNMCVANAEPENILLKDLEKEYYRLEFLVDTASEHIRKEEEVSIEAGRRVGLLYDALLKQYADPTAEHSLKSLNALCVRLVFCLYAEDCGLFGKHMIFHDYLGSFKKENFRMGLIELFKMLDTKIEDRDRYADEKLLVFPYVNGGLFADETIEIPRFNDEIINILLKDCSEDFDWSGISPTIFGAVFESTLNPQVRRSGGMHYTSIENIHKVIDILFLDELYAEFERIKQIAQDKTRNAKLDAFQDKLASLTFLDPALGSGNFITESYVSLRRLENEIMLLRNNGQGVFGDVENPVKVSIKQFYGIEINDFAVSVAKTALWIAESQMHKETERIVSHDIEFFPLKNYSNIVEGNALQLDWSKLRPSFDYIMGNPPFVGRRYRTPEQIKEVSSLFSYKDIDYVACWYMKAAKLITGTNTKCAFVSTNSITQGEQVAALWKPLVENYNVAIDFAYRTFRWDSESTLKAHVYCVIIGFSDRNSTQKEKILFDESGMKSKAKNINGYLLNAPNVFINIRSTPLCNIPLMKNGNVPLDGDALKIEIEDYPDFEDCKQYVKQLMGGRELLHNEKRYVLWLVGISPKEIKEYPKIYKRVQLCRENRLVMKDKTTQKLAETPTIFRDTNNPKNYIALPMVSSENRRYLPMAYLHSDIIPTNQIQTVPDASLYEFGILTSNVHMAWMRAVCGRLEMRYRYSKDIVYNNFPWCADEHREEIAATAQAILDARAIYPDSSLADLYDEATMPVELRKAHQANDRAVMKAYGFSSQMTESECVAELFKMYERLTK